jgi:hypothetical protein
LRAFDDSTPCAPPECIWRGTIPTAGPVLSSRFAFRRSEGAFGVFIPFGSNDTRTRLTLRCRSTFKEIGGPEYQRLATLRFIIDAAFDSGAEPRRIRRMPHFNIAWCPKARGRPEYLSTQKLHRRRQSTDCCLEDDSRPPAPELVALASSRRLPLVAPAAASGKILLS